MTRVAKLEIMKIGAFDSGVGGFTVLKPLLKQMPNLSVVYLADTAHVPYSGKTPEELEIIIRKILKFFLEKKVEAVIFACNTSSALVLPKVRPYSFVPFYGVVGPGIKSALKATQGKGIGAAANEVTAKSGIFKKMIHEKDPAIPVFEQSCPELVSLVEKGDLSSSRTVSAVREYMKPIRGKIDALILGCTHFPFLKKQFEDSLPDCAVIDPANSLAEEFAEDFKNKKVYHGIDSRQKLNKGNIVFNEAVKNHELFVTKQSPHIEEWAEKVLGWKVKAELLDLKFIRPWTPEEVVSCETPS